jgi:hypothetical protein
MRPRILFLLAAAAAAAMASCGNDDRVTGTPGTDPRLDITDTPRENAEAETAALWLSGDLIAPEDLYHAIRDDLAAIRGGHLDSVPQIATRFFPPWVVTQLIVLPDDATWDKIRNGEPNAIDSLNVVFHATKLDSLRVSNLLAIISFEGRLHPEKLAEIYAVQAGVIYAEPNGYCCDWDNVYPWEHDGHMTYLFRNGYGDCPSGCIYSDFWYFRRVDGQTEYVGAYSTEHDPVPPDWWDEAKVAFRRFKYGN